MSTRNPIVVHWGDLPLDMTSIIGKFKRSAFNAIYTDSQRGLAVGHWLVEEGYEDYGAFPQAEIFFIVEGTAVVQTDEGEYTVGPGDTVLMLPGRTARFLVQEPVRVFYVSSGTPDIEKQQQIRREAAETGG